MKYLSFDCAIKNCGWAHIEEKDNNINVLDFGILNFSKPPSCKMCDNTAIILNMEECELVHCCKKHAEERNITKKKKPLTSQEICKNLIKQLRDMTFISDVDIVILENQPSFMNPISKAIQVMLLSYFTSINKQIIIQNPNQKLFGFKPENTKKKYIERKSISIYLVKNLIPKNDFSKLLQFSKIDDICDAVLMCYCVICSKNNTIETKIKTLINDYNKK